MFDFQGIRFHWLGHDGFKVSSGDKTLYIDPYQLSNTQHDKNDADIVLISHDHFDHLSPDDLKHAVGKKTSIIAAKECLSKLAGINALETHGVAPGDKLSVQGITVEAVAAYNTNKKFHPKSDLKVGFIFTVNDVRIYHAGDTDEIPEMNDLYPHVAIVPVSGTYVMTAEEAADAVNKRIKPKDLAIPMHYGTIVGTEDDARKFKTFVKVCKVQILERT